MDIQDVERNVEVAVNLLKALSNEKRLMVVCALYKGEKNVGELEKIVGLSQSALSQHLARLRRDGLVNNRRHAQTIYYSLSDKAIEHVLKCLYDIYSPEEVQIPKCKKTRLMKRCRFLRRFLARAE
jgi:DNA-binding transcriptional ArsR family regulator